MSMIELEGIGVRARLTKARIALLLTAPFYGALAMRLALVAREQKAPMSTDGESLFFNPRLIAAWSNDRLVAAVAHEVEHCANGHPWRMGDRNHGKWNKAADHVINLRLKASGFDVGENWLADPQYAGMCAEVVYSRLPDEPEDPQGGGDKPQQQPQAGAGQQQPQNGAAPPQQGAGDEPGQESMPGDVERPQPKEDGSASRREVEEKLEAEWRIAVQNAASAAAAQGEGSGSMAEAVEEARRNRIDWRAETRRKVTEILPNDYSWVRPSRRYLPRGLYLPTLHSEEMGTMVVVRDTSGSINAQQEGAQFNAEIDSIAAEVKPRRLIVIDCDAKVRKVWDIEPGEGMPDMSKFHGRGGTDFRPPFDWIEAEGIEPKLVVYLTDLAGKFPTEPPPYEVLWVATTRDVAPFGETLPMLG